jgi:phage protein D
MARLVPYSLALTYAEPGGAATDVTRDLSPFVRGFSYTDRSRGEADTLSVTLKDADGRFTGRGAYAGTASWEFAPGARLTAVLTPPHLSGTRPLVLPLGTFEVDEDEASGPAPSLLTVKAQSAVAFGSPADGFRQRKRTVSYEGAGSLRAVCAAVAQRHGLALSYLAAADPPLGRADQAAESDAAFLSRLCRRFGLHLSVRSRGERQGGGLAVTVYDEGGLAGTDAVTLDARAVQGYDVPRRLGRRAAGARCDYLSAGTGKVVTVSVGDTEAGADGRTPEVLTIRARVESEAEARALCRAALREGARAGSEARVDLRPADLRVAAGTVVDLAGLGSRSGRRLCTESTVRSDGEALSQSLTLVSL